jgi:1-deoxy-D-xylulose-5-phosphate synthase
MDRAGVAGADGATHHGVLDLNYMLSIPGMTVTAPKDGAELLALLRLGVQHESGPFSLRWPRDNVPAPVPPLAEIPDLPYGTWEIVRKGRDLAVLAVGTMVLEAMKAAEELSDDGIDVTVVNCRFLKPLDTVVLQQVLASHTFVLTVEEGAVVNGFGAFLAREMAGMAESRGVRVEIMGIPDHFVEHGGRAELLREIDLDARGIRERVRRLLGPRAAGQITPVGSVRDRETA